MLAFLLLFLGVQPGPLLDVFLLESIEILEHARIGRSLSFFASLRAIN